MKPNLSKEIDDIVKPIPQKSKLALIFGVSLATVLFVGIIAFALHLFSANSETAPTNQTAAQKDLKIKGNRNSKIFHLPNCPNYNDISERHIVWFKTVDEAVAAGFRMARNC